MGSIQDDGREYTVENLGLGVYKVELPEEVKCGCCNYYTGAMWLFATSDADAVKRMKAEEGSCEECFYEENPVT